MTKIIDLPSVVTVTANDFVPVYQGGKTKKVSATILSGPPGSAATVAVGTTTTVAAGTPATVTNSGTSSNAVLNFTIPQGPAGATGPTGPAGPAGSASPRPALTGNITYFVRTDGSDSNTGLTNTAGGAFLTIQKAIFACVANDPNGYNLNIAVGAGTFSAFFMPAVLDNSVPITLSGNGSGSTFITASGGGTAISLGYRARLTLRDINISTGSTSSGVGILISTSSYIDIGNVNFGACGYQLYIQYGGFCNVGANYTISGGSISHVYAVYDAHFICIGKTITFTGSPNFSNYIYLAAYKSMLTVISNTFSGTVTGGSYFLSALSVYYGGGTSVPGSGTSVNSGSQVV